MNNETLKTRQGWDLDRKISETKKRIVEWHDAWEGNVSVSFSGGKDSTVLLDIVRSVYPDVPAIFINTGLEYPEIVSFVRKYENVTILRPKIPFHNVIKNYGYPVVSKATAKAIRTLKNPTEKNKAHRKMLLTGIKRDGTISKWFKLAEKWKFLINAPFKISDKCCNYIKETPLRHYAKKTGRMPFIGMMAGDSRRRQMSYRVSGCNLFDARDPRSMPLGFWTEKDVWDYINYKGLLYSSIYDMGESRTGCMFCMFGVHLEKEPNRFQRMQLSHPKQWEYSINKLGCGKVLDFIGVPYTMPTGKEQYYQKKITI